MHLTVLADPMVKRLFVRGRLRQKFYRRFMDLYCPGEFIQLALVKDLYYGDFTVNNQDCLLNLGDFLYIQQLTVATVNNRRYTLENLTAVVMLSLIHI